MVDIEHRLHPVITRWQRVERAGEGQVCAVDGELRAWREVANFARGGEVFGVHEGVEVDLGDRYLGGRVDLLSEEQQPPTGGGGGRPDHDFERGVCGGCGEGECQAEEQRVAHGPSTHCQLGRLRARPMRR